MHIPLYVPTSRKGLLHFSETPQPRAVKEIRNATPKICLFGNKIILSWKVFEVQPMQKEKNKTKHLLELLLLDQKQQFLRNKAL